MKSFFIYFGTIAITICCIAGCQATPSQDYIVNKMDCSIKDSLNDTADRASTKEFNKSVPLRWEEMLNIERFKFIFDVEIEGTNRDAYPSYKMTSRAFSGDEMFSIFDNVLGHSYKIRSWERTRDEIEMEILSTVNSRELLGNEQCDWIIEELQKEMDGLGPESEFASPSSYEMHFPEKIEASNGEMHLYANIDDSSMMIWFNNVGVIQLNAWLDGEPQSHPQISKEDAQLEAVSILEQLNAKGFSIAQCEQGSVLALYENKTLFCGWDLVFTRTEGAYLGFDPNAASQGLLLFDDTQYSKPLPQESIEIFISENGCHCIVWRSPTKTVENVQENVRLIGFDKVRDQIIKWITVGYSWRQDKIGLSDTMYVDRVFLSCAAIQAKDESEAYYLVPAWIVIYREESDINTPIAPTYIAINAIDGSRIQF